MDIVDLQSALQEERDELGLTDGNDASAICLSGGGIRSAAFCLGVIQALAARKLLQEFQYLSTVSGGGYIGGWLTRMIAAWNGDVDRAERELNEYQPVDSGTKLRRKESREPEEISQLRRFTNFLIPKPGLASADTWAGIALWFRNTLINWMVFMPLFLGTAAACVAYVGFLCGFEEFSSQDNCLLWSCGFGAAGLLCSAVAAFNVCRRLPSHLPDAWFPIGAPKQEPLPAMGWTKREIRRWIVWPILIWIFIAPFAFAPTLVITSRLPARQVFLPEPFPLPAPAVCGSVMTTAQRTRPLKAKSPGVTSRVVLAMPGGSVTLCDQGNSPPSEQPCPATKPLSFWPLALWYLPSANFIVYLVSFYAAWWRVKRSGGDTAAFRGNQVAWLVSALLAAGLLGLAYTLLQGSGVYWVAALGPLLVMLVESSRIVFYVAFRSQGIFSDLDREWLARLSGYKIKITLAVTLLILTATCLPRYRLLGLSTEWQKLAAVFGFLTGPVAAWLGKSQLTVFSNGTSGSKSGLSSLVTINNVLAFVSILFGLYLIMLFGHLTDIVAAYRFPCSLWCFSLVALAIVIIMSGGIYFCNRHIKLNLFSMHAVYRNRLVRAFLGSARFRGEVADKGHEIARSADPFTGFAPRDNFRLADCWAIRVYGKGGRNERLKGRKKRRLFPIINVALNRTHGKDTARAERKAEAFTLTPLRCGAAGLQRDATRALQRLRGSYASTEDYACGERDLGPNDSLRGLTLGTAMALSGAAVSPNMGYNSSPFTAFLMTLFNARLGAWLPNPGFEPPTHKTLRLSGPVHSVFPMLKELVGESDDKGRYVYLSDGGHFDNLGLYEMLRRRCAYIVVVDSGRDTNYAYADLGHVLQMALIDLGVQVDFLTQIKVNDEVLSNGFHYAEITYPPNPDQPAAGWLADKGSCRGQLIYLKPYLPASTPVELLAYHQNRTEFPNETTANQFFSESDFESYRRLGELLANELLSNFSEIESVVPDRRIHCLFDTVRKTLHI